MESLTDIFIYSAQTVPPHVSVVTNTVLAKDASNMGRQKPVSTAYEKKGRKESKGVHINANLKSKARAAITIVRRPFSILF